MRARNSSLSTVCVARVLNLFFMLAITTQAAPTTIRFTHATDLPQTGLRIYTMPNAVSVPLSPPERQLLILQKGNTKSQMEVYNAIDFWRRAEQAGAWRDNYGNTLTLSHVSHLPPTHLTRRQSTRDAVESALALARQSPPQWTKGNLGTWLKLYTRENPTRITEERPCSRKLSDQTRFDFNDPRLLAYIFRINRRHLGLSRAPAGWFAIVLRLTESIQPDQAREALLSNILARIAPASSKRNTSKPSRSRFQHSPSVNSSSSEVTREEQSVEASIRDLPDWWSTRTEHYVLLSNMKSREKSVALRIQREIDILHKAFRQLIPPHASMSNVGVIRIFATQKEYQAYVPKNYAWTSGMWMPHKGELVINPTLQKHGRIASRILPTVYHEALHQYLYSAFNRITPSPWFNEGHATLFESIRLNARQELRFIEADHHLHTLQNLAKSGRLDIARFISLSYRDFYATDPAQRQQNYAIAWGLAYYLRKAAPIEKNTRYARVAQDYSAHLKKYQNPEKATQLTFERIDMKDFSESISSFWLSASRRHKAENHRIIP